MSVTVYGATGFAGAQICQALRRRDVPLVLAGRDASRLAALGDSLGGNVAIRAAWVEKPDSLRQAFASSRLVIHCAGPFVRLGEPVVRAAIDCGAHFFDISGEQSYVRTVYERLESAARHRGVAVVSGVAFEVALGDWAASLAAGKLSGDEPVDEVVAACALERLPWTPAGRRAMLEIVATPAYMWQIDRWEEAAIAGQWRDIAFPAPFGARAALSFPSAQIITVPRHVMTRRVQTFLSLGPDEPWLRWGTRVFSLFAPTLGAIARTPPVVDYLRAWLGAAPAPQSPPQPGKFALVVEARRGFERGRITLAGEDLYRVSAEIAALAASELLQRGAGGGPVGVLAPAQVFDPTRCLGEIAARCALELVT